MINIIQSADLKIIDYRENDIELIDKFEEHLEFEKLYGNWLIK